MSELEDHLRGLAQPTSPIATPDPADVERAGTARRRRAQAIRRSVLAAAVVVVVLGVLGGILALARAPETTLDTIDQPSVNTLPGRGTSIPAAPDTREGPPVGPPAPTEPPIDAANTVVFRTGVFPTGNELEIARQLIESRLALLGVEGAVVVLSEQGTSITVGFDDPNDRRVVVAAAAPGRVLFREVIEEQTTFNTPYAPVEYDDLTRPVERSSFDAAGVMTARYTLRPAFAAGSFFTSASAELGLHQDGRATLTLVLDAASDSRAAFTNAAVQCKEQVAPCESGRIAITVDGIVVAAPDMEMLSFDGDRVQIIGSPGVDLRVAAAMMSTGQLPMTLKVGCAVPTPSEQPHMPQRLDDASMPGADMEERARVALDGTCVAEAEVRAAKAGWLSRVVSIDGVPQVVTDDLRSNRLNLSITDGIVDDVTIG